MSEVGMFDIKADANQWIVYRKRKAKDPGASEKWEPVSYHNRLEHAARWLLDRLVREEAMGPRWSIEAIPEAVARAQFQVEELIRSLSVSAEQPAYEAPRS